jgi:chromosomal replication initiator protein
VFFLQNGFFCDPGTLVAEACALLWSGRLGQWVPAELAWGLEAQALNAGSDQSAAVIWDEVASRLRETISDAVWSKWFAGVIADDVDDEALAVTVPTAFARDWIEGRFAALVRATACDVVGSPLDVRFSVAPATAAAPRPAPPSPGADTPLEHGRDAVVALPDADADAAHPLTGKYTFDHFVIGASNRFAHAAALAVAEAPAQAYNPLFVYGGTGLGKTHLLQAIAHYVSNETPALRARYVTSEAFVNDFIEHLRAKRLADFPTRYRSYDVLLVDDVQFLEGKVRIQEEFFHTFNSVVEAGGQIILSSDRPPREIPNLEDRLRSRFEWGLITDVQPPDLETRIAILRKKAERDRISLPDPSILAAIAQRIQSNIRELEGAFTRVVAFASLNGVAISAALVRDVLHDQFPEGARPVTVDEIQKIVADAFNVTVADLRGERRTQQVVYPRQLAMFLCRELTDLSLPKIGQRFGGRDHTTVHYAEGKIARLIREDRRAYNLVQDLTAKIRRV